MHSPSHQTDQRVLAVVRYLEIAALAGATLTATVILAFWFIPGAAAIAPSGWSAMTAATAIGILLLAAGLAMDRGRGRAMGVGALAAALGALALGIGVLLIYAGLLPEPRWLLPSPQTAIAITLAAGAAVLVDRSTEGLAVVADTLVSCLIAFVLFLAAGHAFKVLAFVGLNTEVVTSIQTLVGLAFIAFVLAARRAAQGGLLAILVNQGIGSRIARLVLPGVVLAPFLLCLAIQFLSDAGVMAPAQARAVAAAVMAATALAVVAWMGHHTNKLEHQLRMQSLTDQPTGLLNRRGFETIADHMVRTAERERTPLICFYFDLDGLKRVNDTLGHEAGNVLIKAFADLLTATFRRNDVVARLGGDEFAVLAAGGSNLAAEALVRLRRNADALNASGGVPGGLAYSQGHAELVPQSRSLAEVVAEADAMMYADKARRRAA